MTGCGVQSLTPAAGRMFRTERVGGAESSVPQSRLYVTTQMSRISQRNKPAQSSLAVWRCCIDKYPGHRLRLLFIGVRVPSINALPHAGR